MPKTVRNFQKMGQRVRHELIKIYAKLGEEAVNYAFWKGYKSKPSRAQSRRTRFSFEPTRMVWQNRTGRLMDSMGSAVYVDGVLQKNTIYKLGGESKPTRDKKDPRSGRQALNDYFNKIHPKAGRDDITLIVVAAMYYSYYLEKGMHRGGYRIQVVSAARDYVERNYWPRVEGLYKRFNLPRPNITVIRGDASIRNA